MMETVRPDARGRIYLGELAKGVSSFSIQINADGKIVLDPRVEIPARESWLYTNKVALSSVKRGLQDAADHKLTPLEDLSEFLEEE